MEYYALSQFSYWKYYVLLVYYWLMEYPPVIRFCAITITLCVLILLILLLHNYNVAMRAHAKARKIAALREQFFYPIRQIAQMRQNLSVTQISDQLGLAKSSGRHDKRSPLMVSVFRDVYLDTKDYRNRVNWQRMLQAFKMPIYFEREMRSRRIKPRLDALKNVADIDADLKEAVASRYMYSRDTKLQMTSRLHAARFGMSYPFKTLEEDTSMAFTEEVWVKLHDVLVFRRENGMSIPNLIRWCNQYQTNESMRLFAVNEIRLFRFDSDCPDLLELLKTCHEERLACALIQALGEMKYAPAEEEFQRRYTYASLAERHALAEAFGQIASEDPVVVTFLTKDYEESTDAISKIKLLRVLYDYGELGRNAYLKLKGLADEEEARYFEHIECELIDPRKYA